MLDVDFQRPGVRNDAASEQDDPEAQLMPPENTLAALGVVNKNGGGATGSTANSPRPTTSTLAQSQTHGPPSPGDLLSEKLQRELPKAVESIRQGRIDSFAASAVVTTLFAGIEAALLAGNPPLTNLPDDQGGSPGHRNNPRLLEAYLAFAYISLGLNLGATVASLYLIDMLGAVGFPLSYTHLKGAEDERTGRRLLLRTFGARSNTYKRIEWYWLATFQLGYLTVVAQYGLYIWLHASNVAAALATPTVLIALLPLTFQLFGS